jgi:hypothetical protein
VSVQEQTWSESPLVKKGLLASLKVACGGDDDDDLKP